MLSKGIVIYLIVMVCYSYNLCVLSIYSIYIDDLFDLLKFYKKTNGNTLIKQWPNSSNFTIMLTMKFKVKLTT